MASGAGDGSSLPRDHMANERTHLAWLRTSANVMVVGLAIAQFADRGSMSLASLIAGGVLLAAGAAGVIYGTLRYRAVNHELAGGRFVVGAQGSGPTWAAMILLVAMAAAIVILAVAAN